MVMIISGGPPCPPSCNTSVSIVVCNVVIHISKGVRRVCLGARPNITKYRAVSTNQLLPSDIDGVPNAPFLILFDNLKNVRLQIPNVLCKRTENEPLVGRGWGEV